MRKTMSRMLSSRMALAAQTEEEEILSYRNERLLGITGCRAQPGRA
jgi:hypothetical protein